MRGRPGLLNITLIVPWLLGICPAAGAGEEQASSGYELIYRCSLTYPLMCGPFLAVLPDAELGAAPVTALTQVRGPGVVGELSPDGTSVLVNDGANRTHVLELDSGRLRLLIEGDP
jgi:hypothetical protein